MCLRYRGPLVCVKAPSPQDLRKCSEREGGTGKEKVDRKNCEKILHFQMSETIMKQNLKERGIRCVKRQNSCTCSYRKYRSI